MKGNPGVDAAARYTDRVEAYRRARPGYPEGLIAVLRERLGLRRAHVVADVGCGTGLLALPFLRAGHAVIGVEPNAGMRVAAQEALEAWPEFRCVEGRAEATGLPADSCDLVVAGQAFHWFDPEGAEREFRRILRPPRRVSLVWNTRRLAGSAFLEDYECFLQRWGRDYQAARRRYAVKEDLDPFFGDGGCARDRLDTAQELDLRGLRDRLLSASYMPGPGEPEHAEMLEAVAVLFQRHAEDGKVRIEYDTEIFSGTLESEAEAP